MGRPKGGTNKYWSKEEKLKIVKEMIENYISLPQMSKRRGISIGLLGTWRNRYQKEGDKGLENKRKPGNPLARYSRRKELTNEERLEYENMKLRIENERLKKGYIVRGVGQKKEYISINSKNLK
jgi:Transposase.